MPTLSEAVHKEVEKEPPPVVKPAPFTFSKGTSPLLATVLSNENTEETIQQLVAELSVLETLPMVEKMEEMALVQSVEAAINDTGKARAAARVGALTLLLGLVQTGKRMLPMFLPLLSPLISLVADKTREVKNAGAKVVAEILEQASEFAAYVVFPELLKRTGSAEATTERLRLILNLAKTEPNAVRHCLSAAIPAVAEVVHDPKPKVKAIAREALAALCASGANDDVRQLLPVMLSALEKPSEIASCVQTLASTTFVQEVDGPTLAIIAPILTRGFAVRSDKTKRSCARIIENMSKLVEKPSALTAFLPEILPKLQLAAEHVATPDAREVCVAACDVLIARAGNGAALVGLQAELKDTGAAEGPIADKFIAHASRLLGGLVDTQNVNIEKWNATLLPFVSCVLPEEKAAKLLKHLLCVVMGEEDDMGESEEDAKAEELCNCEFSLAYGNKLLLRKTKLHLKRGFKYGLIGKNDSGKTSLMRAIADHRVDGFPPEHELRTVFVETDIQGELSDLSVLDYIMADKVLASLKITTEAMTKSLNDVGFRDGSPANVTTCVGALSGGWKMKLALARAMLLNADILLLDEPTNHLDSYNVQWVESYLMGLKNVTCMMVSHDSGFLNRVCTHIVQIDNFRLAYHKGNLESFVAKHPDASKAFFELKTDKFSFKFPPPSRLNGVKSKGKAIMKMTDISFTYPGAAAPQLRNVSIQVSLGSRVACVGVNGAGKSTMIKLLTGELEPDQGSGDVWTHPNMAYGYIAQHAFHHIENHLDKTAKEYICWRYQYGSDREGLNKVTNIVTEEEQKQMKVPIVFEYPDEETGLPVKKTGVVKRVTQSRRENKLIRDQEYELLLEGGSDTERWWVPRGVLVRAGFDKLLKQVDDAITTREAMFARPLTAENVKNHLQDVGLEEEFSMHMPIGALSGGQKVKVVLGAALWHRPHVLILDEPTNYLDRDSLAALAGAIREFEGGVVMITHNSQFCGELCPQVWHLENNTLNVKGDADWMAMEMLGEEKKVTEGVDRFGNTVKIKVELQGKAKRAAQKAKEKRRKERIKQGLDPDDTEEED